MTVNLARDGHVSVHVPTETRGTGAHQHHRAWIEHGGLRMGYNRCLMGAGDTRACPDEPDPWVRLSEKAAAVRRKGVDAHPRPFCERHPAERMRLYGRNRVCADCTAEKKRAHRAAARIARQATAA